MKSKRYLLIGITTLAMIGLAQAALAQGVLRVQSDKVKVGGDSTAAESSMEVVGAAGTVGTGNSVILLRNAGALAMQLDDTNIAGFWNFSNANNEGEFRISRSGTGGTEMTVFSNGNMTIRGQLTTAGGVYPDYVFEEDYDLMSLTELEDFISENKHLPNVPAASEMKESVNINELQRVLLEKVEELTLYTIQQQKLIEDLQARLESSESSKN